MAGIPTVIVTRSGFDGIVTNAFSGFGFPAEASFGYIFPYEMFLENSDLSPIEENFDAFIAGLTDWEPEMKEKGLIEPEMITVKGDSEIDAWKNVGYLFYRNIWSDSLPITPPTEDTVKWILTGTDRDPSEVAGKVRPRGGIATVNSIAVALAMAGGRPEYMPVMLGITKIIDDERFNTQSWNATTNSCLPAVIVNGPIAKQIRLGSGYAMLGPDPMHPAGQIIGRALRLILQDIGGASAGAGTMAVYGGMRSTNAVFAEDEEGLPEGWKSLAEERGFTREQNVVTMTIINGMQNVLWDFGGEDANIRSLNAMAGCMRIPNPNHLNGPILEEQNTDPDRESGIVVLPRGFADALDKDNGFSKDDVRQFLWNNAKIPYEELKTYTSDFFLSWFNPGDDVPYCPSPDQIMVLVGGGDQSGHGYYMAPMLAGMNTSVELELPAAWDDILYEAEIDIGAIPSAH